VTQSTTIHCLEYEMMKKKNGKILLLAKSETEEHEFLVPEIPHALSIRFSTSNTETWGSSPLLQVVSTLLPGKPRGYIFHGLHVRRYGMDIDAIGTELQDTECLVKVALDLVLSQKKYLDSVLQLSELHLFDFTASHPRGCDAHSSLGLIAQQIEQQRGCCKIKPHFGNFPLRETPLKAKKYVCLDEYCLKKKAKELEKLKTGKGASGDANTAAAASKPEKKRVDIYDSDSTPAVSSKGMIDEAAMDNNNRDSEVNLNNIPPSSTRNSESHGLEKNNNLYTQGLASNAQKLKTVSCSPFLDATTTNDAHMSATTRTTTRTPPTTNNSHDPDEPKAREKCRNEKLESWGHGKYDWEHPSETRAENELVQPSDLLGAADVKSESFERLTGTTKIRAKELYEESVSSSADTEDLGAVAERLCGFEKEEDNYKWMSVGTDTDKADDNNTTCPTPTLTSGQTPPHVQPREITTHILEEKENDAEALTGSIPLPEQDAQDVTVQGAQAQSDALIENWLKMRW